MDRILVQAQPRSVQGKKVRHLRRRGVTPVNLSGLRQPSVALQVDAKEMSTLINKHGKNTLVNVVVDGGSPVLALLSNYTVHPIKNTLIHIDFQRIAAGDKLTVAIDLNYVGEAPVDKRNDLLVLRMLNTVQIECLPANLPSSIDVDLSGLAEADDAIRVRDLQVGPGVTILDDPDEVLARVSMVQAVPEEAEAAAEEAAETAVEAAEAAEGAEAPTAAGENPAKE